ncbi:MAG: YdcF family protein [Betaproteobacteria bacterium]|nr:MAG: YdcF family protein [Betaproteobacteria bacterium]
MQTALHYASKLFAYALSPLAWVAALLVIGVGLMLLRPHRAVIWARGFCACALVLLLFLGWQNPSNYLLRQLEDQYSAPTGDLSAYHGMIVLGGAFGGFDGRAHSQISLGCAGERVVIPVPLMSEYPAMRLHFTGGSAAVLTERASEADVAENYFRRMGVEMTRTSFERRSRNTFENAVNSFEQLNLTGEAVKPWLLVTSATHMPRAIATFRKAGINVTAYPVDYQSAAGELPFTYSLEAGAHDYAIWLRERVGGLVYSLLDRS